jgi:hypothetical protein
VLRFINADSDTLVVVHLGIPRSNSGSKAGDCLAALSRLRLEEITATRKGNPRLKTVYENEDTQSLEDNWLKSCIKSFLRQHTAPILLRKDFHIQRQSKVTPHPHISLTCLADTTAQGYRLTQSVPHVPGVPYIFFTVHKNPSIDYIATQKLFPGDTQHLAIGS